MRKAAPPEMTRPASSGQPGVDPVSGGEDAGGIGPQPEKGGVAQGDLAGVAQKQVESHHQQGMDADEIEQGEIVFIVQADGQGQDQSGKQSPAIGEPDKDHRRPPSRPWGRRNSTSSSRRKATASR